MYDPGQQYTRNLAFLQAIVDAIEEGVVVQNNEGVIVGFNQQACTLLGLSPEQLTGKTSYDPQWTVSDMHDRIIPPDEHPIVVTRKTGKPCKDITMHVRVGDKHSKWFSVNTQLFTVEAEQFVFATFTDISERMQANKQLEESEQKFHSFFDNSPIGKAVVGITGNWINVNEAFCTMTGYTREELFQHNFVDLSHPEELERDQAFVAEMIQSKQETFQIEKRYIRKDGSCGWVTLFIRLVLNQDQQPEFFIIQTKEISQLKQLNRNLQQQNEVLLNTQAELQKKIGQLKDFAGIITHDVRGPASAMRKLIEIYEQRKDEPTGEQALMHLKNASEDLISNLNELIKLLQWHLEAKPPFSYCSFAEITEQVTRQLETIISDKKATIETRFEVAGIQYAKPYLLSILYNLISNALKYARKDQPPHIIVHTHTRDNRTQLKITDNGMGIDLQQFGSALFKFQKAFHGNADSKGIGLYLVKHQVEEFGGNIQVDSTLNEGTSFTITF